MARQKEKGIPSVIQALSELLTVHIGEEMSDSSYHAGIERIISSHNNYKYKIVQAAWYSKQYGCFDPPPPPPPPHTHTRAPL